MEYLLIKNGLVVTGNKVYKADILIGNTKILEIGKQVQRPLPGVPVIDAAGRFVLPGGIDYGHHELLKDQAHQQESDKLLLSQITGGTTCLFETITSCKVTSKDSGFSDCRELLQMNHMPDFAFHLAPTGYKIERSSHFSANFIKRGVSSYFISSLHFLDSDDEYRVWLMSTVARMGLTLVVEIALPEPVGSGYILSRGARKRETANHLDRLMKLFWLLKDADFPVLFSKLRFEEELELFAKFKDDNKNFYAELDIPCNLGEKSNFKLNEFSILGGFELQGKLTPLKPTTFVQLISNDNYLVASPSFGISIGNLKGSAVFNRPDKYFGIKFYSGMLYTMSVIYGSLAITDFVSCFSTRPAKLMGLYPKKGVLREGSDADIVIWNPDYERNLYCNFVSSQNVEELKLQGKADFVFVNGRMVYDGETFYRENLQGSYLFRTPYV